MSEIAIRVEGLGKQYRIGKRERYKTLRDTLTDAVMAPTRRLRSALRGAHSEQEENHSDLIWALKDVSFEVPHGAVVGVIGRNGAGKSTLLKILSRITEPTEGFAEVSGRVGSLLEVGTGFHPELTGRENVYLNGAILGMKKAEIERKFDEIVAFAEVERFIDTPVKHYSSGMYTRLAFAVAAHLEPEILIVDEVLAVGDQRFQNKCLSKMSEVGKQGRIVIYVSHSMPSIQRLCERAIILEQGRVKLDAEPRQAVAEYLGGETPESYYSPSSVVTKPTITRAQVSLETDQILLSVEFDSPYPLIPMLGFIIYEPTGAPVFGTNARMDPRGAPLSRVTSGRIGVTISSKYFRPNRYLFSLFLGDSYSDHCILEKVLHIDLENGQPGDVSAAITGCMIIPVSWHSGSTVLEAQFKGVAGAALK